MGQTTSGPGLPEGDGLDGSEEALRRSDHGCGYDLSCSCEGLAWMKRRLGKMVHYAGQAFCAHSACFLFHGGNERMIPKIKKAMHDLK